MSTVGEFCRTFRFTARCSCNQSYDNCSFWLKWCDAALREGIDFLPGKGDLLVSDWAKGARWRELVCHQFPWPMLNRLRDHTCRVCGTEETPRKLVARAMRLARIACAVEQTNVFFDTSKDSRQVRFLLCQPFLALRVCSIIRDGRGVIKSLMKWYGLTIQDATARWLWSIRQMQRAMQSVPTDAKLEMRLEDFTQSPDKHRREFFRFCGVDPDSRLDYRADRRHIVGNPMRFTFDGTIRNSESWRETLTKTELEYFEAHAGAVNRSLGYND